MPLNLERFQKVAVAPNSKDTTLKSRIKHKFFSNNRPSTIDIFENLTVFTPQGDQVLLSSRWKDNIIILKVLPRLGCALCRYEARSYMRIEHILAELNVKLVGVAFEDLDLKTFVSCGYWKWDVLIDPRRIVYKAAGLKKLSLMEMARNLMSDRFKLIDDYLIKKKLVDDTSRGDMRQLGGTFVISPNSNKFLYEFRPDKLETFPNLGDIVRAIGGDPDNIAVDYDRIVIDNYAAMNN